MDLRHLAIFRAVVERGSFSAAAESLGISQPAVSFHIRSLEERFGQRLIDRSGRRISLTEAGEVLDEYARRLLALEDELEHSLDALGTEIAGELLLGSSTGPGELVLPRLCAAFRDANPKADVRLAVHDTQGVCERVLDGTLELGIVGAESGQRGLDFEPFLRDELIVAVPVDHALAARDELTLRELADVPLIMQQAGSGVRHVLVGAFAEIGIRERDLVVDLELGLQQSVKAAVLDGLGVSVLSRLAVEREAAEGALAIIPIADEGLTRDFFSVRPSGRTPKRIATAFLEFAASSFDAIPGDARDQDRG